MAIKMRTNFHDVAGFAEMLFEWIRSSENSTFQSRTERIEEGNAESQTGKRRSLQREPIAEGTTETLSRQKYYNVER